MDLAEIVQDKKLVPKKPYWIKSDKDEPLNIIYDKLDITLRCGKIANGYVVKANGRLKYKGIVSCPVSLIYSYDKIDIDIYKRTVEKLLTLKGKELFILKYENPGKKVIIDKLANAINNEMDRLFNVLLPWDLTGGHDIYYTTTVAHRKHLENGILSRDFLPVLAAPEQSPSVLILPYWYWK